MNNPTTGRLKLCLIFHSGHLRPKRARRGIASKPSICKVIEKLWGNAQRSDEGRDGRRRLKIKTFSKKAPGCHKKNGEHPSAKMDNAMRAVRGVS